MRITLDRFKINESVMQSKSLNEERHKPEEIYGLQPTFFFQFHKMLVFTAIFKTHNTNEENLERRKVIHFMENVSVLFNHCKF